MLYENLLATSHFLEPEDLSNAIVDFLPPEMPSCKPWLYGALYDQMLYNNTRRKRVERAVSKIVRCETEWLR